MSSNVIGKFQSLKAALERTKQRTAQSIAQNEAKRAEKQAAAEPVKKAGKAKPEKIQKGPKNDMKLDRGAMTRVEVLFGELLRERYGEDFIVADWTVKQRVLVKQMFTQYGAQLTVKAVRYFHEEWDYITLSSKGRIGGTPTLNLLWGMREQVFADVQTGVMSFREKLSSSPAMKDEYKAPGGDDSSPKVGW